jgi:hypothetical protein
VIPRAPLEDVVAAVRKACYDRTGEALEELTARMGWTLQEYRLALVGNINDSSSCKAAGDRDRMDP